MQLWCHITKLTRMTCKNQTVSKYLSHIPKQSIIKFVGKKYSAPNKAKLKFYSIQENTPKKSWREK